jgi:hypothetical protein
MPFLASESEGFILLKAKTSQVSKTCEVSKYYKYFF